MTANPIFARLTDKLGAKAYVASVLGDSWLIPTLWSGEELPPIEDRKWPIPFVMKANHGSKWNMFVRKPEDLDWPRLEASAKVWMAADYRPYLKEWFHREIPKKIMIEPFQGDDNTPLIDYKFYCFNGQIKYILVAVDRHTVVKGCMMSPDWLDTGIYFNDPRPEILPRRPEKFSILCDAAETLARDFSFVRIDLYDIGGELRFGEFTFTPHSGLRRMHPPGADLEFGRLWSEALSARGGQSEGVSLLAAGATAI